LCAALLISGVVTGCDRISVSGAHNVPRVGYLAGTAGPLTQAYTSAFLQGLREQGYTPGDNIEVEWAVLADHPEAQFSDLAAELVSENVQVIVTSTTPAVVAAAQATDTIPIVSAGPSRNLTDLGLVQSDSRPGGNVTGTGEASDVYGKLIELLAEAVPKLSRVAYLRNPLTPGTAEQMARSRAVADTLNLNFIEVQARTPDEIDAAIGTALDAHAEGLVVSADNLFGEPDWRPVQLANAHHLPAIYSQVAGYIDAGGMMAYSADFVASQHRAAAYVAKILKGTNPAELPVERAMSFELGLNLKTAEAVGVTLPEGVLLQTTKIVR
jgi:ABC-type uncharacterized transport system substrate-binding protein